MLISPHNLLLCKSHIQICLCYIMYITKQMLRQLFYIIYWRFYMCYIATNKGFAFFLILKYWLHRKKSSIWSSSVYLVASKIWLRQAEPLFIMWDGGGASETTMKTADNINRTPALLIYIGVFTFPAVQRQTYGILRYRVTHRQLTLVFVQFRLTKAFWNIHFIRYLAHYLLQ